MGRRAVSMVLGVMFLMTSCVLAQTSGKFKVIKTREFEGAIILEGQLPLSQDVSTKVKAFWTPAEEDVLEAEALAKAYLEEYNGDNAYVKSSIHRILGRLGKYKRQYLGYIEVSGDKMILINYFYDNGNHPYWDEALVTVLDGGSDYFQVKVNVNKKECVEISINGEGW